MARDVSFLQYMRAHGNVAGPTQRPLLTGAISGLIAFVPYELILDHSGARDAITRGLGLNTWISIGIGAVVMILAGMLYAAIFKRAANDRRGGWLFGASFGFLLWVVTPITSWQLLTSRPLAVGLAAMGLFGGHIVFGIILGLSFPLVHSLTRSKMDKVARNDVSVSRRDVVLPETSAVNKVAGTGYHSRSERHG